MITGRSSERNGDLAGAPAARASLRNVPSTLAATAVCVYLVGFALPFRWDLPLMVLAVSAFGIALGSGGEWVQSSPLTSYVLLFLASTAISLLLSDDVARSWALGVPLLAAMLLFLVVSGQLSGWHEISVIYGAFGAVTLGLAIVAVWQAVHHIGVEPAEIVSRIGSPILLVPNDIALLAVVAPLSLSIVHSAKRDVTRLVAFSSIVASACAIVLLESRVATLAFMGSLGCAAMLLNGRRGTVIVLAVAIVMLTVDAVCGFPLLRKFAALQDARVALWLTAVAMFRDAPILGHGPRTFGLLHGRYAATIELPPGLPVDTRIVPWAHNLYLEMLAEQGLVGLVTLVALLTAAVMIAWRTFRTSATEARSLAAGALAALLGIAGAGLVELSFVRQWVVVTAFTLFGVVARLSSLPQSPSVQPPPPEVHR
jgi:O-antigen ligase